MTPADAASRAALFVELEKRAAPILDGAPQWRRFTPGRIEIFGKHTDYAGGHSLLAAVPRGITLAARSATDGIVRVGDIFDGQVIEVDPSQPAPAHYRGLQRYVHVVAHRFFLNFPGCELGANIAIASDLPRASGLSSSSALVVGVALALDRARRPARSRRVATAPAPRPRSRVVSRLRRERPELSRPAGIRRRRHARRQRGSHRDHRRARPITSASIDSCRSGRSATRACRRTGRS